MIYKADLVSHYGLSLEEAGRILEGVDREALFAGHRARYSFALWDKSSPVNGVASENILSREDFPKDTNAAAYFIFRDLSILFFQYKNPQGNAGMTVKEAVMIAENQIDRLAESDVDASILQYVREAMEGFLQK